MKKLSTCLLLALLLAGVDRAQAKAWRQAVEEWLVRHGHIRIHNPTNKNQKVLPYFPDSMGQN